MYLPDIPKMLNKRSFAYLDKSRFTLDVAGVAGFFGGAEASSAMATVHMFEHRRYWGWYNSPGSYEIARRYGPLTKFGFFFGGGHNDPAELLTLFELDGLKGPQFLRVHSGTIIRETNHLAAVFLKECTATECLLPRHPKERQPVRVTIAELNGRPGEDLELKPMPIRLNPQCLAAIPILVSTSACILCGVAKDWYSFSLILLGIIANGVSCLLIGSIELKFMRPQLAGESTQEKLAVSESCRVNGILISPTDIVLLKGREDAAMAVACGKFVLETPPGGTSFYQYVGWCSVLLLLQFVSQLLLIPQASLFGQIMFVASLAVSWAYNLWLCSLDKAVVQQKILLETILKIKEEDDLRRYRLENWPAMVMFVLLILIHEDDEVNEHELKTVLDVLVEDTSDVWTAWKLLILEKALSLRSSKVPTEKMPAMMDWLMCRAVVTDGSGQHIGSFSNGKWEGLLEETQLGIEMFKKHVSNIVAAPIDN